MEFRVLGQLEVVDGERPVALGSHKQRALMALLLIHHRETVSTDRIIDELWGEDSGADRQNALWVHVSNLRSALEPERERRSQGTVVLTRAPGYVLDVDRDRVDAYRFERLLEEGRSLVSEHPDAAAERLREALGLWRGRPYEEFTYEAFAQAEIARLDGLRLEALETRIDADLARGLSTELVSELEALTRQHRLHERLTGQLMVALHRSGRQADALRAYHALQSTLRHELGVEPSTPLQELERRVLMDDPSLVVPATGGNTPGGPGLAIRGYEIRAESARTAAGVTYKAFQPAVGREVAVTMLAPAIADEPSFIRRFEGEASLVAALEHPHIVPLYDYWREPGAAYVVTRLMPAGSLADVIASSALGEHETARMVDEVASALESAHRHGIVHGDLRAETILFDNEGASYVSGFGVAGTDDATPVDDVAALATLAARALAGLSGTFEQIEGALAPEVAGVLRTATIDGTPIGARELAVELGRVIGRDSPWAETGPDQAIENPYRGLAAFGVGDAAVFHGRERVIERLVSRLGQPGDAGRFVAVVGPSGSGKSSVVRAGLIPALASDAVPMSSEWFVTGMTPGLHPFEALEDALMRVAVDPPATLLEQLSAGENGLRRAARRVLPDDRSQLLLVIDQFEELFTLADPDVADAFLAGLAGAVADDHSRVRLVVTLRADFYDGPLRHRAFGELLREGTEVITPMSTEELEQTITLPAASVGVEFTPALVAEIVNEVVGRPGALPLLQFALTELFEQRPGRLIDMNVHRQIGGTSGALVTRAEDLYSSGDDEQRSATRQIFLRLVTLGEGAHDTRRRVLATEIEDLPMERAATVSVIDRFSTHRLLTFDRDPVTRSPTVEISHEALLTEWSRLRGWIDEGREEVRNQRRLHTAMAEWIAADRADDHLLSGGILVRLEDWATNTDLHLAEEESAFLQLSVAAQRRRAEEAEQREADRITAEERARRRLRVSAAAVVVAAVVGTLAVIAVLQRQAAVASEDELATTVRAQDLAAASVLELQRDPSLATRLALEAAFVTSEFGVVTPEALDALHWAIQESNLVYPAGDDSPVAVRPGPRGPTGVFALPVDEVIALAQSADIGRFSEPECQAYFDRSVCDDPARTFPTGLAIQGGDDAYGVVTPGPGALAGTRVELISAINAEDEGFTRELERFEAETGIITVSPSLSASIGPAFELGRRRQDLEPFPDLLFWPQPALLASQDPASMIDLRTYLDLDQLRDDFGQQLIALGTVGPDGTWPSADGPLFGLPTDVDVKGLVFYPRARFESAGYEIPSTLDELVVLSQQMVADGRTPWCFHFASDAASGWPGTDLIESLVAREGGPEAYDDWLRHEIAFDDPVVQAAGRRAETLLLSDGFARGGSESISRLHFIDEGLAPLLDDEPGCWLYHQAEFMFGTLGPDVRVGVDVDVFPLPPIRAGAPLPAIGGGNLTSVLVDRPEVRRFVQHIASPRWGEEWAAPTANYFVSPNARFDVTAYGADADPALAATRQTIGELARASIDDGSWRFDASDLMPGPIGSATDDGERGAFWQGMLDVVDGQRTMDAVLRDIEVAWQELESG